MLASSARASRKPKKLRSASTGRADTPSLRSAHPSMPGVFRVDEADGHRGRGSQRRLSSAERRPKKSTACDGYINLNLSCAGGLPVMSLTRGDSLSD
eukprot:2072062-Rhodomonas_salina.1